MEEGSTLEAVQISLLTTDDEQKIGHENGGFLSESNSLRSLKALGQRSPWLRPGVVCRALKTTGAWVPPQRF